MNRPIASAVLALLALVALPSGAGAAPVTMLNGYHQRLVQLPDLQRRAVLRRAILDSRERCGKVTVARVQGAYGNLMMWTARCVGDPSRTGDYAVFLGPDGSVQVRACNQMRALGLPMCRPFPPTPPAPPTRRPVRPRGG